MSFATGRGEIWTMDVKAATHRRVVVPEDCGAFSLLGPDLSPDRKRLAFVGVTDADLSSRSPSITLRVFIAFAGGGLPVRATGHDEENVGHLNETVPTWSPAGDRLTYVRQGAPMWLEVVRPGGEDRPVRLWEGEAYYPPQWSPTGEWIAIADTGRVFLVSPDGPAPNVP